MSRLHQVVLVSSTLVASWVGMQAIHEAGHVAGARLTGGRVARVVLYPLTISRTDLAENPHPLAVVWAGPAVGVLVPLAAWVVAAQFAVPGWYVLRFFAGFCLVANGAYIAGGSFDGIGDCGEMAEAIRTQIAALTADLLGPDPGAIDRMLARDVAFNHLAYQYAAAEAGQLAPNRDVAVLRLRELESAQRRLTFALKNWRQHARKPGQGPAAPPAIRQFDLSPRPLRPRRRKSGGGVPPEKSRWSPGRLPPGVP